MRRILSIFATVVALVVTLIAGATLAFEGSDFSAKLPQLLSSTLFDAPQKGLSYTEWDQATSPDYCRVCGPAVVDEDVPAGTIVYEPLDVLGRAQGAWGTITYQMMAEGSQRERKSLQNLRPSGWGNNASAHINLPDGSAYNGYFWNRSHLIAKSLGGSDDLTNLICGTRTQNVGANDGHGGMAYGETMLRSWLSDNPHGHAFYRALPVYEGTELVCRSVIVDIKTSDGSIDQRIEVYNTANGYTIDYATGRFW